MRVAAIIGRCIELKGVLSGYVTIKKRGLQGKCFCDVPAAEQYSRRTCDMLILASYCCPDREQDMEERATRRRTDPSYKTNNDNSTAEPFVDSELLGGCMDGAF